MRNFIFSLFAVAIAFAQPSIDSVWFSEETDCDGRNVVEICYIFSSDTPESTNTISVEMSSDGGATWDVPLDSIWDDEGDIGVIVDTGLHCLNWEMGYDLQNKEFNNLLLNITLFGNRLDTFIIVDSFYVDLVTSPLSPDPRGITGESANEIWFVNCAHTSFFTNDKIYKIKFLSSDSIIVLKEINTPQITGELEEIAIFGDKIYVNNYNYTVHIYDTSGLYQTSIPAGDYYNQPIAFGAGYFWMFRRNEISSGERIYKIEPTTFTKIDSFDITSGLGHERPDGMEWALGKLWITSNDAAIYEINTSNGVIDHIYNVPATGTLGPEGLGYDGEYFWYADLNTIGNSDKIYKISVFDTVAISVTSIGFFDSRPPSVSITSPTSIVTLDDTYTFQWTVDDMFWANDPCSVYISVGGMRESHIVTGTEFEWTAPSEPCATCTLIVAARDSFCNWGYDTCTFAVGISYECDAHPDPFTPDGDRINPEAIFDYPTKGIDDGNITITIFDMKNRLVRTLENGISIWNGKDEAGNAMPKGPYLYIIKNGSEVICHGTIHLAR